MGGADMRSAHLPVQHLPVMYEQVMDGLRVVDDGIYLDGTFGRGGHARGVLQRLGTGGRLLLMDKDPEAIAAAEREFGTDPRVSIHRGSFTDLAHWSAVADGLDGILFDLGVSSPQLDVAERGFSFGKDGPLDMRMDPDSGQSAAQWLASASEQDIADVLWTYGEERMSRRIARTIVARRAQQPIERTGELAQLISSVMPRGKHEIHPATRSFQAIRIHINRELADLETGLDAAHAALKPQGRLAVISFHSLEDRMVKRRFKALADEAQRAPGQPAYRVLTKKVVVAEEPERLSNPRSRSAKLRVVERVAV